MTPEQQAEIEALYRTKIELQAQVCVLKWKRRLCIWDDCQEAPEHERGVNTCFCTKHWFEIEFREAMRNDPARVEAAYASKSR